MPYTLRPSFSLGSRSFISMSAHTQFVDSFRAVRRSIAAGFEAALPLFRSSKGKDLFFVRLSVNTVLSRFDSSRQTLPPCSSAIRRARVSPRPVPLGFPAVTNRKVGNRVRSRRLCGVLLPYPREIGRAHV